MVWIGENDLLRSDFGFGINTERIHGVCFDVIPLLPVEHHVGGKKNEWNFCRQFCQHFGGFYICLPRERGIGLTVRAFAQGRAVDDGSGSLLVEGRANGGKIEQVKIGAR